MGRLTPAGSPRFALTFGLFKLHIVTEHMFGLGSLGPGHQLLSLALWYPNEWVLQELNHLLNFSIFVFILLSKCL